MVYRREAFIAYVRCAMLASVLHAASSSNAGDSMMSAPAGKKEQPKKDKSYLARAVAAPKTPTGSGSSPLPSPPTWAPSPQSADKAIDAARHDPVNIDFGVGDGLPQRGEAARREPLSTRTTGWSAVVP